MTITPGTRVDHFQVGELLGAGGMGTVYRAYDPRLQRHVAIKVLAPGFGDDPDRVRRFEQEALAVARLAHPNILAVHDIGTFEGSPYIVTELLEGGTLREAMSERRVSARKALDWTRQIVQGLAAAHERGIVHRDIKPENLFVTKEGRVKILDFGIAKLTDLEAASGANSATLTAQGLGPVGTAAYMSPEQARGNRIDFRSDLFSLGVVLYEMVAGVSPFRRATAAETMTAILREDPPELPESPAGVAGLHRVLQHCLEKNPADRFQTARDLLFALDSLTGTVPAPAVPRSRRFPRRVALALAGAAVLALTAAAGYLIGRRSPAPAPRDVVSGVYRLTEFEGLEEFPAISPDAKAVAFTARVDGVEQIFVRLVAGGTPLQITRDGADHASRGGRPIRARSSISRPRFRATSREPSGRSPRSAARLAGSSTASEVEMSVPTAGSPCSGWRGSRSSWSPPRLTGPICTSDRPFHRAFLLQVPAMVSRREVDRLPAGRWCPLGSLRR